MKKEIITNCLDLLADFELLNQKEQKGCFQQIIDVLGGYPKPQNKFDKVEATKTEIGVYLFVSNVRNTCKLSILGILKYKESYLVAQYNCEFALSLLVDSLGAKCPQTTK
jgi:hypothetical protein